jgi:DNA-binding NarL/FixJ family response regulator
MNPDEAPAASVNGHMDSEPSSPTTAVRVFIVEDHALVREGTAELLGRDPGLRVVGQAASGEELLAQVAERRPDVALVDIELAGMSGIALADALRRQAPDVRVLVVSAYDDWAYVMEALEAGVSGYLLKTASAQELIDAVRAVSDGVVVLDAAISERLTRRWHLPDIPPAAGLTWRETDVLRLLGRGMSNKQIAGQLGLGVRTVESHVSNVLSKLGVGSRTEAALIAVSSHLVRNGRAPVP